MKKQEHRIVTKIIRDLSLLMLNSGHLNFSIDIKEHSGQTVICFKSKTISDKVINKIEENMTCERAIEVETYGFELLGDFNAQNELALLGCLTDDVDITKEENETIIKIIRKNLYGN
jgi:hypothetical protein